MFTMQKSLRLSLHKAVLKQQVSADFVITFAIIVIFCPWTKSELFPKWPLTPPLLGSYVQLYQSIIMSKSYENTYQYVDTISNPYLKTLSLRLMTQMTFDTTPVEGHM